MKQIAIFCLLGSLTTQIASAQQLPMVLQMEPGDLLAAKQRWLAHEPMAVAGVRSLMHDANSALTAGPYTLVHKEHPLPGVDSHEYVSLAPYFWPNPDTKDGLPYVRHDGERNPEIREYDARPFGEMSGRVKTLAMAYYFTDDERYAARATLLIRTWFLNPATRMNPDLQHAQLVKGVNDGRGTGIIESIRLIDVLDSISMMQGSKAWTSADQDGMHRWMADYVKWMHDSKNGKDEEAATNNHGCWFDVQYTAFNLFLGRPEEARQTVESAKAHRVAQQIQPDGTLPRELARTKSFGYCTFCLSALTELADLGRRVDVDLWGFKTKDGRSIAAAINWMLPYVTGQERWKHQQIAKFSPSDFLTILHRAYHVYHDPAYEKAIDRIRQLSSGNNQGNSMQFLAPEE
jgi:Alginate lyase